MKIFNGTVWAYGLLGLMTFGYFISLQLWASAIEYRFEQYLAPVGGELPGPTRLFATENAAWVWSLLAVASLIGNMAWGRWRAKRTDLPAPHQMPILCHLIWIVTWTFFHLLGIWLPFFKMGETI